MSIYCASIECKHRSNTGRCTAKKVELYWNSVMTAHQGRQEFLRCKQYEKSTEYAELEGQLEEWLITQNLKNGC